jgi:hypothetical protein
MGMLCTSPSITFNQNNMSIEDHGSLPLYVQRKRSAGDVVELVVCPRALAATTHSPMSIKFDDDQHLNNNNFSTISTRARIKHCDASVLALHTQEDKRHRRLGCPQPSGERRW